MEKERKITAPEGCEIEKVELIDGVAVVTFREKERKLPKSWEELCEMYPIPLAFATTNADFDPLQGYLVPYHERNVDAMHRFTSDRATAEAVLALCKLIQLRNCYNGDWVPDWNNYNQDKFTIEFHGSEIFCDCVLITSTLLYFKTADLRDEFLRNFRDLIEKLKPIYGINEGGEE
jgi:hypothetical protein